MPLPPHADPALPPLCDAGYVPGTPGERGVKRALVYVVAPFVVAGVLAPAYSYHEFDFGLALWQAVVGWPIGAVLLIGPVALARNVRDDRLYVGAMLGVSVCGVATMVAVGRTDDAQAGIAFMYAPLGGCLIVAVALVIDRLVGRGPAFERTAGQ